MSINTENATNRAQLEATIAVAMLQQRTDIPPDVLAIAVAGLPAIAAITVEFDAARAQQGVNPDALKATQQRFENRLAETSQNAIVNINGRLAGVLKAMTPAKVDAVVLDRYRSRMAEILRAPGDVVLAYYSAAEAQDDTSMQAIEGAPAWDKLFTLSEDQRMRGRRLRWGEQAKVAEAMEEVRFHVATLTATVREYIMGNTRDVVDELLAR